MKARPIENNDYEMLCEWWKDWKWTPPTRDMLPGNGEGGIIIESNGQPVCAGFLFFTNSKMCWIEFIVSNFKYREKDRGECIELLINILSSIAEKEGFKYIYTSLKSKPLVQKYLNCGFELGDNNCQELIKRI